MCRIRDQRVCSGSSFSRREQRNSRMVALPPIADIPLHCGKRRFVPLTDLVSSN